MVRSPAKRRTVRSGCVGELGAYLTTGPLIDAWGRRVVGGSIARLVNTVPETGRFDAGETDSLFDMLVLARS